MPALPGDPLSAAGLGQRWVLRVRQPDGSASDVVGWLDSITSSEVGVATVDQSEHRIDRSAVLLARRAPPARGAPPPDRVSAEELERRSVPGWLALASLIGSLVVVLLATALPVS